MRESDFSLERKYVNAPKEGVQDILADHLRMPSHNGAFPSSVSLELVCI